MDYQSNYTTLESMSQAVWYNTWSLKKFSRFLLGDILEVGCGFGNFTKILAQFGTVWAVDNDPICVQKTKRFSTQSIRVERGDIERDRSLFGKKKFDTIVCLNVLEHILDDERAIVNMYQKLKNFGNLVLLVPIHPSLYGNIDKSIHHYRRYRPEQITHSLNQHNFRILFSRKLNFFGAIGWWFSGKILKRTTVEKTQLSIFNLFAPFILPVEDIIEPSIGTSILIVAKKEKD